MAEAIKNVTILLDRLYNLKGDENVLIKDLERQIGEVEKRIDELAASIAESTSNKGKEEGHLSLFLRQKDQFETLFSSLTNDSFSALEGIEVFLDVGTLKSNVEEKSPAFIRAIMEMIDGYKTAISDAEEARREAETQLANLRIDVATVSEQRNQLISLLEQSLSPNEIERESLTANFVKQVLIPFGVFTTEEIAKLTKIIMFPDEGLLEYDRMYEERVAKGLIGYVETDETEEVVHMNEGGVPTFVGNDGQVKLDLVKIGTFPGYSAEAPAEEIAQEEQPPAEVIEEEEVAEEVVIENPPAEEPAEETPTEEHIQEENRVIIPPIVEPIDAAPANKQIDEFVGSEVVLNFEKIGKADLEARMALKVDKKTTEEPAEEQLAEAPAEEIVQEEQPPAERIGDEVAEEAVIENPPAEEPPAEAPAQEEPQENLGFDRHEAEARLSNAGLNINKFQEVNTVKIEKILESVMSVDENVIKINYEILRSINLEDEAYKMRFGHMYITDPDFNKKITLLRAKNISETKIQAMIKDTNSGLRVSYDDLEKRIQVVESLHGKIEDANIYLIRKICKDIEKYEANLDTLLTYGINIDDKEVRNFMAVLFESLYIAEDSEILKDYVIGILKSNGKYALSVFWKKPEELLADIDDLIEADLENVIGTHAEILGMNSESFLRRVRYCEDNNKKVFIDDMRSEPCEYITSGHTFKKQFGDRITLPELGNRQANNAKLIELIGNPDYVEILLNTLNDYYINTDKYSTPQVVDSMKEKYDELIHYLEDNCKAEIAGKFTYKVNGVCICKNKLERNIAIILNALDVAGQPAFGVEREIVLVSALYNSRLKEETLEKVVGSCLGFNQAAQEVKR